MTDEFVSQAARIFPGSTFLEHCGDTFEIARDRLFNYLRERNRTLSPVARWQAACEVAAEIIELEPEPYRSWGLRLQAEDLGAMLRTLHRAHLGREFNSPDPKQWRTTT